MLINLPAFSFSTMFSTLSKRGFIIWADFNPLPDDKILDLSKLKQIADDILKRIYNEK